MKKHIYLLGILIAGLLLFTGCSPQEDDNGDIPVPPDASFLDFTITPDAENPNLITFTNTSKTGFIFLWNFGNGAREEKGEKVSTTYISSGTYDVSLTVFTSTGSTTISKPVVIEKSLLYTFFTGGTSPTGKTWRLDYEHDGYFGVGPATSTKPDWWSATANSQDLALYDNVFTFISENNQLIWKNSGYIYSNWEYSNDYGIPVEDNGDKKISFTPSEQLTWKIIEEKGKNPVLELPFPATFGFWTGSSTFEILNINDSEIYLRSINSKGDAWFYKLTILN